MNVLMLCWWLLVQSLSVAAEVLRYPPALPGVAVSSTWRVFVANENEEVEVPVAFFEGSASRGLGPPRTSASVARFFAGTCRVEWLAAAPNTTGLLREIGRTTHVEFPDATFPVSAGTNYALNVGDDWLFLWVDADLAEAQDAAEVLGPGEHLSGPMDASTSLALEPGAVLRYDGARQTNLVSFLSVTTDDVRISGGGAIDATGAPGHALYVKDCKRFELDDVFVFGSGGWAVLVRNVTDVNIRRAKVFSGADGIDLDSTIGALVEDTFVNSWDDAVVVKTTLPARESALILVRRSQVLSRKSAYKLGTESVSDFRNVSFLDVDGYDLDRGAVVYARDGGAVRDVSFRRVRFFFKDWSLSSDDDDKVFATALDFELQHRSSLSSSSALFFGGGGGLRDLVVDTALLDGPLANAAVLKGVDDQLPLADLLLANVQVVLGDVPFPADDSDNSLLLCKNSFVSDTSVVAANVTVLPADFWAHSEEAATAWPQGLAPGWTSHDAPPASFAICRRSFDRDEVPSELSSSSSSLVVTSLSR
mmetsp:Transcript_15101/g.45723  ORF Transcript_15101/g.45723 Transcript_15101/m.45723 type:complete len:535 (+) Transcript_15101:41-1645(+)